MLPGPDTHLRIARPCRDLSATERFWVQGLDLDVPWRTPPDHHGGHDLVMVGWTGASWHLELVADPQAATPPAPTEEDLLVLYLGAPADPDLLGRLRAAGGRYPGHRPQPLLGAVGHHHRRPRRLPPRPEPPHLGLTGCNPPISGSLSARARAVPSRVRALRRGHGTPLLLLHGAGVDHRILTPLEGAFRASLSLDQAWERIYLDLPGSGGTPAPARISSSDAVVEEILAWVDAELGPAPFALVGNSWGGLLARAITARRPEQVLGMCLICPVIIAEHSARALPPRTVLSYDPDLLAQLGPEDREDYETMAVVQSPQNWDRFRDHVLPGLRSFDTAAGDRIGREYELRDVPEHSAPSFPRPTLILTGRHDQVVGYADAFAMLEHYPRSTFVTLDAAGHNAHLDQPHLTNTLLPAVAPGPAQRRLSRTADRSLRGTERAAGSASLRPVGGEHRDSGDVLMAHRV